jgi:hypothetical protein
MFGVSAGASASNGLGVWNLVAWELVIKTRQMISGLSLPGIRISQVRTLLEVGYNGVKSRYWIDYSAVSLTATGSIQCWMDFSPALSTMSDSTGWIAVQDWLQYWISSIGHIGCLTVLASFQPASLWLELGPSRLRCSSLSEA